MDLAALDWVTDAVVAALARDEPADAPALTFLLRRYRATGRADLRDALEPALAHALDLHAGDETAIQRAAWLTLFADATAISEDERLQSAADNLVVVLRRDWGRATAVDAGAASVGACLAWGREHALRALLADAVDELERIVAAAYQPEEGLARTASRSCESRGYLADHVGLSGALLIAYDVTGRLPYSMLAEELMQFARRTLWDEQAGAFDESPTHRDKPFLLNCEAARILCRLAALHRQPEYLAAAVVAPDADYADLAARLLSTESEGYQERGPASASYGLALEEWLALRC